MTKETKPSPIFKQLMDFLPLGVFFIVFTLYKDLIFATYFLLGSTAIMLLASLVIYKKIETMALIVSSFVFVFGGLTLFFDDANFIKLKPTILNFILALIFCISQFIYKKKTIMELMLDKQLHMPSKAWQTMNNLWIFYFILTATVNLLVWKMMSEESWVFFRFWGMMAMTLTFSVIQVAILYKYLKNQPLP